MKILNLQIQIVFFLHVTLETNAMKNSSRYLLDYGSSTQRINVYIDYVLVYKWASIELQIIQ